MGTHDWVFGTHGRTQSKLTLIISEHGSTPPPPPPPPLPESPMLNSVTMNELGDAILHVDDRDVYDAPSEEEIAAEQRRFAAEQRLGEMSPPTPLTNATLSSIEKTTDFE